jgi:hypothetical protein
MIRLPVQKFSMCSRPQYAQRSAILQKCAIAGPGQAALIINPAHRCASTSLKETVPNPRIPVSDGC